jgi:hypothetical protein
MAKKEVEEKGLSIRMAVLLTIDFTFSFWLAGVYLIWYGFETDYLYVYIGWSVILISVILYVILLRSVHNGRNN